MKTITAFISSLALASMLGVAAAGQPTKTAASDKGTPEQQCLAQQAKEYEACQANCTKLPDQKACAARCDKRDKDAKQFCKKPQV